MSKSENSQNASSQPNVHNRDSHKHTGLEGRSNEFEINHVSDVISDDLTKQDIISSNTHHHFDTHHIDHVTSNLILYKLF